MKKLTITNKMSMKEQRTRISINHVIEKVDNADRLRKWLLDQVTGVEIDGVIYTFPCMTYEEAMRYYREAVGC